MKTDQVQDSELLLLISNPATVGIGFRKLVEMYQRKLYAHIIRIVGNHDDTNDLLQETFMKAWKNIGTFRNEAPLYNWLLGIATNEALQHLRKLRIRKLVTATYSRTSKLVVGPEGSNTAAKDIQKHFEQALAMLAVRQRIIFGMRYFDAIPFSEIASILNRSEGTVKASYHAAYHKIRKYLEAHAE